MKYSKFERFKMIQQMRILKALYPLQAEQYQENIKVLENGFELEIDELSDGLYEGLDRHGCEEVRAILDMVAVMQRSNENLGFPIPEEKVKFQGFAGNDHFAQHSYIKHLIDDTKEYEYIKGVLNSHNPYTFPSYQTMLERWRSWGQPHQMSAEKILELLDSQ